jgi:hypothetical protein
METESNWSKKLRQKMEVDPQSLVYKTAKWNSKKKIFIESDPDFLKSVSMSSHGTIT